MKSLLILSVFFFSFNATTIPASEQKPRISLQSKNGNPIRTKTGKVIQVKQSNFHKSLI